MTKRKAITERMKVDALLRLGMVRCPKCSLPIEPKQPIDWDHIHCIALDGPHVSENIRPMHRACHQKKTKADLRMIKKTRPKHTETFVVRKPMDHADEALLNIEGAKQYRRKFPKGRKLQSRPFRKRAA